MLTYYPAIGGWFVAFRRKYLMRFSDTPVGRGGDSAKAAETFLPLIPTTPTKGKMDVDLRKNPLIPYKTI